MTHVEKLRERIAEAIKREVVCCEHSHTELEQYRQFADAVIAELGLEPQPHPGPDYPLHRWVTDWVADE